MKKYLSIVAVTAMAASAFAQGTINFANNASTVVKVYDQATQSAVNLASPAYVQLFAAPGGSAYSDWTGTTTPASWLAANPAFKAMGTPVAILAASPGRFVGGTVTVTNIPAGGPTETAIVAWKGNYSSFDAAVAAGAVIGASGKIHFDATGNPLATPVPGTPVGLTTGTGIASFTIGGAVIPEPTSLALVGLGAAAMLVLRRRK